MVRWYTVMMVRWYDGLPSRWYDGKMVLIFSKINTIQPDLLAHVRRYIRARAQVHAYARGRMRAEK